MKAAVYHDYAAPVEIVEVAKPLLQDSSVLIQVHAASLNPIDNILRAGYLRQMLELSFPHVKGYDVSGKVVEVGKDVKSVKVGDEVFARPNQEDAGAIAEFARLQESELAIKPANISHEQAASVPLAGLTAWQALVSKGNIQAGDKVLIHAGSGGVGTLAIQIAKHFGAFVATTTSGKNADLVKDLGADLVIDYTTQTFEDELSDYDLVVDTMGGETLERSFKVLKKGGTIVSVKGQDTDGLAAKYGVNFEWFFMWPDGEMLAELGKLLSDGTVKTVIDSSYPMDQSAEAFDRLATGRAKGKIVVSIK
ncbi:NADP-dependent oxidoreductase [Boseongicola aestuarii]|uniref:Zinc-type alcohol dehydrogenase-like protein n=1 Tax=Boseongicola aestuarii TaxID=1470561 RepID=A0A238J6E8_9RHOB|nr:NADP-dependent oxidoreductase [Boseongicola aestuarii]SMX25454.1 Zinc-type alcohol dehydrogenase-like protein [Boseongicola aestuarii]